MKTPEEAIEEMEARRNELLTEANNIARAIWALKLSLCPIKVGDVVRYNGQEFKVIEIDRPDWQWVYANPKRADGTWGSARRHLLGELEIVRSQDQKARK